VKNKKNLLNKIILGIEEVKGENIVVLDLSSIENAISNYFVICDGNSNTQVSAIANSIKKTVSKELKEKPYKEEGLELAKWILMDYVDVIVHIFQKPIREFYDLESFWKEAKEIKINN
jgi:ribosome-associated protein